MQKHVNLVDLVKSFPTNIYLQNLASVQKRTSPLKFAHLAEKSANGSVPNLSTKAAAASAAGASASGANAGDEAGEDAGDDSCAASAVSGTSSTISASISEI